MTLKTADEVVGRILQLSRQKMSVYVIRKNLVSRKICVSVRAINGIIRRHAQDPEKKSVAEPEPKRHFRPKRNSTLIGSVERLVKSDDPISQREITRRVRVSQPTVFRIINEDLESSGSNVQSRRAQNF